MMTTTRSRRAGDEPPRCARAAQCVVVDDPAVAGCEVAVGAAATAGGQAWDLAREEGAEAERRGAVTLVVRGGPSVTLPGLVLREPRRGFLVLELPPLEDGAAGLSSVDDAVRERVAQAKFSEALREAIAARWSRDGERRHQAREGLPRPARARFSSTGAAAAPMSSGWVGAPKSTTSTKRSRTSSGVAGAAASMSSPALRS
jgi:hypothetical protein